MGQGPAVAVLRARQHVHAHAQAAGAALQWTGRKAGVSQVRGCPPARILVGNSTHSQKNRLRALRSVPGPQVLRQGHHAVRHDFLLLRRTGDVRGPRRRPEGVRAEAWRRAAVRPQQAAVPPRQMHRRRHVLLRRGPALRLLCLLQPSGRRQPVLSKGQRRAGTVLQNGPRAHLFLHAQRLHLLRQRHRGVWQQLLPPRANVSALAAP